jgi:hypothetical protein
MMSGLSPPDASKEACTANDSSCAREELSGSTYTVLPSVQDGSPAPTSATTSGRPAKAEANIPSRSTSLPSATWLP